MLLLSLILYLILLSIATVTGLLYIIPFPWFGYIALFGICTIIVRVSFTLMHSFQEEFIPIVKKICKREGVSYLMLFSSLIVIVVLIDLVVNGKANLLYWSFLLPIGGISFLNAINIELLPSFFDEYDERYIYTLPGYSNDDEDNNKVVSPLAPDSEDQEDNGQLDNERDISQLNFQKLYKWQFEGKSHKIELPIRPAIYNKYREFQRVGYDQWAQEYVTNGICGEIRLLSQQLLHVGKPQNSYKEVEFVLAFTQEIVKYENDATYYPNAIIEGEYPKYPIETLVEETGDCEDSAILAAAILKNMGYDSALIFLPGHCALGIAGTDDMPGSYIEHNQSKYFYCETTASGWRIGDLPDEYEKSEVQVFPIAAPPVSLSTL